MGEQQKTVQKSDLKSAYEQAQTADSVGHPAGCCLSYDPMAGDGPDQ